MYLERFEAQFGSQHRSAAAAGLLLVVFVVAASSQSLPDKIRGYKVYDKPVVVKMDQEISPASETDASFRLDNVSLADVSLTGFSFDLQAAVRCDQQSGRVDFLTFRDFRINGIPIEIEEYHHAFVIEKGEFKTLPQPINVFVPSRRVLEAAWKEVGSGPKEWTVTGRVFVFGRFRKFGFFFKRAVPVDVFLTIRDPLASR